MILNKEKLNKINKQKLVSEMFYADGPIEFWNDAVRIKNVIKKELDIDISITEAAKFWEWRSDQWDACWLILREDDEIVKWFIERIKWWLNDDEDNLEEYYE